LAFGVLVYVAIPETRPGRARGIADVRSLVSDLAVPFRDPLLVVFLLLCLGTTLAFGQAGSTLPLVMRAHGISPAGYGALIAINGLLIVGLQLPAVEMIRSVPRSRVMAVASLLVGIGFACNAHAKGVAVYALGIVIWTLGEILQMPVSSSVVVDLAPPAFRGGYQGAFGLLFAASQTIAPLTGGFVLQHLGGTWLWYGCLAVCTACAFGHLRLAGALSRRLAVSAETTLAAPGIAGESSRSPA